MKFRLQFRRWATIIVAVLTIAMAFFLVKPVSANNTVVPTTVTQTTNQPNAPNASSQIAQQSSELTGNSQQTNQSTSAMESDGANANKSATAAAKSTKNNLSADKETGQSQQAAVTRSNNSQVTNSQVNGSNAIMQEERESQPADSHELNPDSGHISAKITDANGNEVPAGETPQINEYDPINIRFNFDLTGQNIHPGDYFKFSINNPGNLLSIQNTSIQLNNSENQNIGTATLTSGNGQISGRVTFNVTGSDVTGNFEVQLKVDSNKASGEQNIPVTITLPNDHVISAIFHYVPGTDNPEERFSKYSYNSVLGPDESNSDATPDNYRPQDITKGNLTYALRMIHHHGDAQYTDAKITDQLQTPDFTYDQGSFLVYWTQWTYSNKQWSAGKLHYVKDGYTLTISSDGRSFTLEFNTPVTFGDNEGYVIFYRLLYKGVPVNKVTNINDQNYLNHQIANKSLIINNQAELTVPNGTPITYPQTMRVTGDSGSAETNSYSLTVTKTDNNGKALAGATFQLLDSQNRPVKNGTTDANGQVRFTNLLRGSYTLREVTAPTGYSVAKDQAITLDDSNDRNQTVTVTDNPLTTSITVTKIWQDQNNKYGTRPSSITVNVMNDNTTVDSHEVTPDANGNWTYTFTGLPMYDAQNKLIHYTLSESSVAGYTPQIDNTNYRITNILATTSITVTKTWQDQNNKYGTRPSFITVNVMNDNTTVDSHEVTPDANSNWTYTFTGLPMYDAQNKLIHYTLSESSVAGYTPQIDNTNYRITNTLITTSITVTKTWQDQNNKYGTRPSFITVNVMNDNTTVDSHEVTPDANGNWTYTFTGLPMYDAKNNLIHYTLSESSVAGYTPQIDNTNYRITNTLITTSITVTKTWQDQNNKYGTRPSFITVNVMNDNTTVDSHEVTPDANSNWTYTFTGLPMYDAQNKLIHYTLSESSVAGYTPQIDNTNYRITNTLVTTSATVTKQWVDGNDQDGIRPKISIDVHLIGKVNDQTVSDQVVTVLAANGWTATVGDLPEYNNGQKITYTWTEPNVPTGYTAKVDGNTITNTHTPATISKTVTKQWVDNDNQDGIRPGTIKVNLLANGKVVRTIDLTAANNWTATLDDLAQKANGQDIDYIWEEADVPAGYQATVDGDVITNTHTPATISKTVTKQWVDNDNQDGIRPDTIKVNLLANGQVVKTVNLTAANGWTATLNDLAQKANGQNINYTWEEADVPAGYQADVNGDVITNTHTPATISKTVTKQWVDNDNQDGLRPGSIKINLLANGQIVKTVELTATNNWTATIDDLAQKANGQDIDYTWEEADVPAGYQVAVDGDLITNTHVPATISKTVTKQWNDNDNQDGIRPGFIKVNLLANGKVVRTIDLTAANNWTATIDGLAQKANGQDIDYTWEEADVPAGYESKVDGDVITNIHTPATISKTVTKQWVDNDNQDGIRPETIKVNLLANGQVVRTIDLTAANNWTATIDGLAQKANGQNIDYTWEEADVPAGYQAAVDGNLITNIHIPATISKTVTKQWVDNDNQDGIRPESIKVNLLANGQVVRTIDLTAANNWTATIDGLAQKSNGQDIVYTWEEANVPAGYESKVDGDVITNTHAPLTTKVTVTKVWNDADNKDGLRPASVTINLLANGQVIRTVELNAANNWRAEFDDLMVYSHQGRRIVYTVEEANVPAGYQSVVSQDGLNFTVTNTHQPTKPTEPTTPVTPDQPDQPTKPTEPTTPVTPEQPSQPTTPAEPTTPVTPGQPVQPVTPVVPGQPNVPAQPVQPSQPVSQGQPRLPQTGNHDGLALMVLGLVLMSMTIYVGKQRD